MFVVDEVRVVSARSLGVYAEAGVLVLMLLEGVVSSGLTDEDAVSDLIGFSTFMDIRSCGVSRLNVNPLLVVVVVVVWTADDDDECVVVKLPDNILIGNSSLLATSESTSRPVGVCEDILCCVFLKRK